jgi:hypothetical protein
VPSGHKSLEFKGFEFNYGRSEAIENIDCASDCPSCSDKPACDDIKEVLKEKKMESVAASAA